VLVADEHNDRILVLNPTLSEARPLPLPTGAGGQPLNNPFGLWLDESRGRLYVGEYGTPYRVLVSWFMTMSLTSEHFSVHELDHVRRYGLIFASFSM
jgi:hypothetical protein